MCQCSITQIYCTNNGHLPLLINGPEIQQVEHYKFCNNLRSLKWEVDTTTVLKKDQPRLFFLGQLKKFSISREGMKAILSCSDREHPHLWNSRPVWKNLSIRETDGQNGTRCTES